MTLRSSGPEHLAAALAELIQRRGWAHAGTGAQVQAVWAQVAGPEFAGTTRVLAFRHGVLQVAVGNAPLLAQLAGFHKGTLLSQLQQVRPDWAVRDLKFKLDSQIGRRSARGP